MLLFSVLKKIPAREKLTNGCVFLSSYCMVIRNSDVVGTSMFRHGAVTYGIQAIWVPLLWESLAFLSVRTITFVLHWFRSSLPRELVTNTNWSVVITWSVLQLPYVVTNRVFYMPPRYLGSAYTIWVDILCVFTCTGTGTCGPWEFSFDKHSSFRGFWFLVIVDTFFQRIGTCKWLFHRSFTWAFGFSWTSSSTITVHSFVTFSFSSTSSSLTISSFMVAPSAQAKIFSTHQWFRYYCLVQQSYQSYLVWNFGKSVHRSRTYSTTYRYGGTRSRPNFSVYTVDVHI